MPEYQWDATDYAKNSSQQQVWARELINKLDLRGRESLLDIGCGDGKVTLEIKAHLPHGSVVGVDLSADMVRLAQERFPPADYPGLRFEQADASRLLFHEEFDVVFSNATLHWIIDHRPVLRGIYTALKPGGKALLQMGGAGNNAEMMALLAQQIRRPPWAPYFVDFSAPYGYYGVEEYTAWLGAAGLRPQRVELIPKDMVHAGRAGLAGWVRTTHLPYTQRLPADQRHAFIDELLDAYLAQRPLDAQGLAHVGMVRLEVEALR